MVITTHRRKVLVVMPRSAVLGSDTERSVTALLDKMSGDNDFQFIHSQKKLWFLKRDVQSADVIWLHGTIGLNLILAFLYAKKMRKPVLITVHKGRSAASNVLAHWFLHFIDQVITRPMLKKAQQVAFIGDATAEHYHRHVGFTAPIKVIPNGVDSLKFYLPTPEKRNALRQRFALRHDQPVLLVVGSFTARHGLDVIYSMARRLPHIRFWLFNPLQGKGAINPLLWHLQNVHVFNGGEKGQRETSLVELYQSADLLLSVGSGDAFPCAVQEAMACGLPVMTSPETAKESRVARDNLFIEKVLLRNPHGTAELWAKKLETFPMPLPIPALIPELADFAHEKWRWVGVAEAYATILKSLPVAR